MKAILQSAIAYRWFGKILGGKRGRAIFVSEYLRPRAGERMLDIGCGEANILDYLPHVDYVGFDASKDYISAATARYGHRGRFYCRTVSQDVLDEIGAFDVALAIGILHHLTDAESLELFQLAFRALKDAGRLVTFDGCYLPRQSPVARYLLRHDRGKFVRTPEEYLALARRCFPVINHWVREDLLPIPYTHFIMECVKA